MAGSSPRGPEGPTCSRRRGTASARGSTTSRSGDGRRASPSSTSVRSVLLPGIVMALAAIAIAIAYFDKNSTPIRVISVCRRRRPRAAPGRRTHTAQSDRDPGNLPGAESDTGVGRGHPEAVRLGAGVRHGAAHRDPHQRRGARFGVQLIGLTLIGLLWLESVVGFCVGCFIYSRLIKADLVHPEDAPACGGNSCQIAAPVVAGGLGAGAAGAQGAREQARDGGTAGQAERRPRCRRRRRRPSRARRRGTPARPPRGRASPRTATSTATPMTAPSWRAMASTAEPTPYCAGRQGLRGGRAQRAERQRRWTRRPGSRRAGSR